MVKITEITSDDEDFGKNAKKKQENSGPRLKFVYADPSTGETMPMTKENGFEDMEFSQEQMKNIIEGTGLMNRKQGNSRTKPSQPKNENQTEKVQQRQAEKVQQRQAQSVQVDQDDAQVESFQAVFFAIPLAAMYLLMRHVVHLQFQMVEPLSRVKWILHAVQVYLALFAVIFSTFGRRNRRFYKLLLALMATLTGCMLIWTTEHKKTFGSHLRAPGLAVLWVYSIAVGDLTLDVISLAFCALFHWTKGFGYYA